MAPRALTALAVASLVLNVALLGLVLDARATVDAMDAARAADRSQLNRLATSVDRLQGAMQALREEAGLVATSSARTDFDAASCDGVPVTFDATLNRGSSDARVRLQYWPVFDALRAREAPSFFDADTRADPESEEVDATRPRPLAYRAVAVLSDVREYRYRWVVEDANGNLEASREFALAVASEAGAMKKGHGVHRVDADTVRFMVHGSPDTRACSRVASADLAVTRPDGGNVTHALTRPDDPLGEWSAEVPRPSDDAELVVLWHLKDGRTLRDPINAGARSGSEDATAPHP